MNKAGAVIIMNGRTEEDRERKVTCIGHGRGLGGVLDLVMVKMEEEIGKPEWFRGLQIAAQEGSGHLPILYRVKWGKKGREIEMKKKRI